MAGDAGVIRALGVDDVASHPIEAWLRGDGAVDPLSAYRRAPRPITRSVVPRDGFQAAHAQEAGGTVLASADHAFESVLGIARIGP